MSELKVYHCNEWHNEYTEFYLKYDADKVIAYKDKEIAKLSKLLTDARGWLIESQKMHKRCADNAIKQLRHQKYKRCMAMARGCRLRARWFGDNAFYKKEQWALKWHKRWLELAKRFEEAK